MKAFMGCLNLLDISHCVEESWMEPLKTKSPVMGLISLPRVQDHMEMDHIIIKRIETHRF